MSRCSEGLRGEGERILPPERQSLLRERRSASLPSRSTRVARATAANQR